MEKPDARRNLKTASGTKTENFHSRQTRSRRSSRPTSALPLAVQEFLGKFCKWEESFQSPARRMAYIRQICDRIAERYAPEKIILFGSHAWGQPTPDSDIDLLIVMHFVGSPVSQAITISHELGLITPMDIVIRTPEQVQERLDLADPFMRDIWQRGKVLYEARHG